MSMVSLARGGVRYALNLVAMVRRQRGPAAGLRAGLGFGLTVAGTLLRYGPWLWRVRTGRVQVNPHPEIYSAELVAALARLSVRMQPYHIDLAAFQAHVAAGGYPSNYAGGPLGQGGARDQKLLEYFVSLDLLDARCGEVVIDVASEWSLFPSVVRRLTGATVYQQDLIYEPGVHGCYIGGSATRMPLPDGFADKLVLHNAFENFEGNDDTDFIREAWRVLKPGGLLCIVPLYVAPQHTNLTDPLLHRPHLTLDVGARMVEVPWWHNRFGRYYAPATLQERVLTPGGAFETTIYCIDNVREVHPLASLHFALVMRKPLQEFTVLSSSASCEQGDCAPCWLYRCVTLRIKHSLGRLTLFMSPAQPLARSF